MRGKLNQNYGSPFLTTNDTKDTKNRDKRKQWPSLGEKRSIENNGTHNKFLPKSLYPRK